MNLFDKTNAEIRRVHKHFTKEFTVYNYEWDDSGGANEYADGDWTTTVSTVDASIRLDDGVTYSSEPTGNESDHDVFIYVNPEEISLTLGNEDETRATEFEDENNRKYKAVGFHDESSLYRVMCREV